MDLGGGRIGDDDFSSSSPSSSKVLVTWAGVGFKGVEVKADLRGTVGEFMLVEGGGGDGGGKEGGLIKAGYLKEKIFWNFFGGSGDVLSVLRGRPLRIPAERLRHTIATRLVPSS